MTRTPEGGTAYSERNTKHTSRLVVASFAVFLALVSEGCGGTGPSPAAPSVSGSWDVVLLGTRDNLPGIMALTEAGGTVTGTLQLPVINVTETLSGTVSQTREMVLTYRDPITSEQGLFRVTIDGAGRTFNGTFTLTGARGDQGTGTIQGTKR